MKKAIAKKWIKALRSGKYKQTRGKLKGRVGFCCLGVLCDISGVGRWRKGVDGKENQYGVYGIDFSDFGVGQLPNSVRQYSGLKHSDGAFGCGSRETLTVLNDNKRWNFKKIAAFIEKNWLKL